MMCRGKGSRTELAGCPWNGKEAEQSINTDLTESSKSPTSIEQSNKQWIANIRFTENLLAIIPELYIIRPVR